MLTLKINRRNNKTNLLPILKSQIKLKDPFPQLLLKMQTYHQDQTKDRIELKLLLNKELKYKLNKQMQAIKRKAKVPRMTKIKTIAVINSIF